MSRLPYDHCRCEGAGCDVANDCLRHLSLLDMGIANITARITDFWSQGHAIMTTMISRDGKRYGKWSLEKGAQE